LKWLEELDSVKLPVETVPNPFHGSMDISWQVLRADMIHPVCSGNKFFKLRHYLREAVHQKHTTLLTEGGPWSNHLVATAYAARSCGLESVGIVNGWKPALFSDTLEEARGYGMKLVFRGGSTIAECMASEKLENAYFIPAGGAGVPGVQGAMTMLHHITSGDYTHIICAVGSGTMLAGLILAASHGNFEPGPTSSIGSTLSPGMYGVSILRHPELESETNSLLAAAGSYHRPRILHGLEQGGYAKKSAELLSFMNLFFAASGIPTDFVYTGKLMFAVKQLIDANRFPPHSRILTVHSGGLQGNRSLKKGELIF
jgi:1-aminocyclopropane-1-carboxylate deaminase/D-cysteine desulfhydrase-like pyridoxal-dependent ACC family enzyme